MLQIAKWDLSQCDQCYLSKDMKGMNVVVDEHLVTSESKECCIALWMLKRRRLSHATPPNLRTSLFQFTQNKHFSTKCFTDSRRLKEQRLSSD